MPVHQCTPICSGYILKPLLPLHPSCHLAQSCVLDTSSKDNWWVSLKWNKASQIEWPSPRLFQTEVDFWKMRSISWSISSSLELLLKVSISPAYVCSSLLWTQRWNYSWDLSPPFSPHPHLFFLTLKSVSVFHIHTGGGWGSTNECLRNPLRSWMKGTL